MLHIITRIHPVRANMDVSSRYLRKLLHHYFKSTEDEITIEREKLYYRMTETDIQPISDASSLVIYGETTSMISRLNEPAYTAQMSPDQYTEYRRGLLSLVLVLYTPSQFASQVDIPNTMTYVQSTLEHNTALRISVLERINTDVTSALLRCMDLDCQRQQKLPWMSHAKKHVENYMMQDIDHSEKTQPSRPTRRVKDVIDYTIPAQMIADAKAMPSSRIACEFLKIATPQIMTDDGELRDAQVNISANTPPFIAALSEVCREQGVVSDNVFYGCIRTWLHWLIYRTYGQDSREEHYRLCVRPIVHVYEIFMRQLHICKFQYDIVKTAMTSGKVDFGESVQLYSVLQSAEKVRAREYDREELERNTARVRLSTFGVWDSLRQVGEPSRLKVEEVLCLQPPVHRISYTAGTTMRADPDFGIDRMINQCIVSMKADGRQGPARGVTTKILAATASLNRALNEVKADTSMAPLSVKRAIALQAANAEMSGVVFTDEEAEKWSDVEHYTTAETTKDTDAQLEAAVYAFEAAVFKRLDHISKDESQMEH